MLKHYLEKYFGYKNFLPGQEKVINLICQGKDTLVVMPTGGGKSLCYQLPALLMPGVALVISPLIALMKDQLDSLLKLNYPATFLNSSLSREESIERLRAARNNQYKLIYIAPEKLNNDYFLKVLSEISISFLAIDEAHCISEWGHDFRPAYLNIVQALKSISISHTVALTATATPDVRQDIVSVLQMHQPNVLVEGFDRTNLNYFTEYTTNKNEKVAELLLQYAKRNKKKAGHGSTIIYCGTRKQTEETHNALAKNKTLLNKNIISTYYHGGLNDATRYENQDKFISSKVNVIVATNAFGMGIDKPDVHNVIHIHLPSSVEAYYQEAGRAGRDGLPANCYLLYDYSDVKLGEWFIEKNFPTQAEFEAVYSYIYSFEQQSKCLPKADTQGSIPINSIPIALNMERNTVLQVLKHFASLQIIARNSFSKKSKIAFNYSKNEMLKMLDSLPALYQPVFEALIRSFPNSEQNKYFELDILYLSQKYNITLKEMSYSINYLADRQIIAVELAKPGDSINVIAEYRDFATLNIDFQKQQYRKEWMLSKLNTMQEYAQTRQCKRNFILEYFDDRSYKDTCLRCSSCIAKHEKELKVLEKNALKVLAGAIELNGKFGFRTLVDYLVGLSTKHAEKYDFYRGKYFGALKNLKQFEIDSIIDTLLSIGYLEITDAQYTLLVATTRGKNYIKEDVKPLFQHKFEYLKQKSQIVQQQVQSKDRHKLPLSPQEFIVKNNFKGKWNTVAMQPASDGHILEPVLGLVNNIHLLFKGGKTIDEVAKMLNIPKGNVANILQKAIEQNQITEYQYYASPQLLDEVKGIVLRQPSILLRDVQSKLQQPVDIAQLRIVLAFARKNIL